MNDSKTKTQKVIIKLVQKSKKKKLTEIFLKKNE